MTKKGGETVITGKALNSTIDANGNIVVKTEYTLTDGTKIMGYTRYNFINFTAEKVRENIEARCKNLMRKVYSLKRHVALLSEIDLSTATHSCENVSIVIKPALKDDQGNIIQAEERLLIDDK